ncbi:low affinity immunoglobulin gamma Fc region receptor II-like [Anoplopoma fimbria]|uniref:low affinity immunoglobulin gamma Fc region receptor II-like n=1 Tax=Anoplopoma fimbria TaxID=229290 RepID=UPI0023EE133C|nr:low affinity immunoglobulin gamma Fc region receptor II-like [Anoplopoma fimbria]
MELTGLLLTLSSITVTPNRSQFFKYESLSLSCDEDRKSPLWRVKAKTARGVSECGRDWGHLRGSTCFINEAYIWNSGEYWCESTTGETTPAANISITGSNVILESPVFPVMEGESVTLRCTTQSNSSNLRASIFMKDRSPVDASITRQMTIPSVSRSDGGLYMCVIIEVGASTESWLTVREREEAGRPSDGFTGNVTAGPGAPATPLLSVSRLMCHLVVGAPYLVSTVLLALIYRDRARAGNTPAVTMEMPRRIDRGQRLANDYVNVSTEHDL